VPLDLSKLLQLQSGLKEFRDILASLRSGVGLSVSVLESAKPCTTASIYSSLGVPVLLITAYSDRARYYYEQLSTWCSNGQTRMFPEPDAIPYERLASDNAAEIDRIQVLAALKGIPGTSQAAPHPPLVIASAPALMQRSVSHADFEAASHRIETGMRASPFDLLTRWQGIGYRVESTVDVPGTVSHRGGIVDIYPSHNEMPARIEFFGDTIETIRLFDPATQRSIGTVPAIWVTPSTELLAIASSDTDRLRTALNKLDLSGLTAEAARQFKQDLEMVENRGKISDPAIYAPLLNKASLIDYLPENGLIILDDSDSIRAEFEQIESDTEGIRQERIRRHVLPEDFPRAFFSWTEIEPALEGHRKLEFSSWKAEEDRRTLPFKPAPTYAGQVPVFVQKVGELLKQKKSVIVVSHQAGRLSELFEEQDIVAPVVDTFKGDFGQPSMTLLQGLLGEGWCLDGQTYLFTDTEIFGFIKQRRMTRRRHVPRHKLSIDIKPGDYVVHIEHGVARLIGVQTMRTQDGEREYLVLEYAAGDRLYVPADQIDRVSRYVGASDRQPALSRLGTQEWNKARQRVSEAVEKVAKELLALYAMREIVPGFAFSRDSLWQQELEASFPYVETPDQLTVQQQVKEDMQKPKPMDRLVCGDVGYGKTEIAVRAAFKAVMDHRQVAVLVPTTVLAEQHYVTFGERFSAFPVRVEVLSRFRTHRQQQAILDGLADGTIDVCIGTHRLIQKDVIFKNLGLLIIDEEQRFGVAHKEFLKKMRHEVDVLALSATPIPRTLHMSLVGVRDMSVMETPPEDRLPVRTYVAPYEDRLVREAIVRELERHGQVFFVHNRVQSIASVAAKLQAIVPEAKFVIGHGQMSEEQLEEVMTAFVRGQADVLVCTTIIESGLDMPNVNTIIVNQADRFGLTQLYQLRGRVGRGANTACAYFLYDRGKHLTEIAERRLKTIFEATELGAGFGIAMKDLEIRGAGNLLGLRQSGHITAVGFNLYTQLLAKAVDELKAKQAGVPEEQIKESHLPPPTVDLPLPAFIPEEYVEDLNTRINLYQKLVKLQKTEGIESLEKEFNDRFGAPPPEVENLLYGVKIKILGTRANLESVAMNEGDIVLRRFEGMRFDRNKLEPALRGLRAPAGSVHFDPLAIRINPKRIGATWPKILEDVVRKAGTVA
jgi:transcription-repair coupling factor (superfamily II helicase)